MKVILLENIKKLGVIGDTVEVKDGFARNFLLPKNKCLRATKENLSLYEAKKEEILAKDNARKEEAEKLAEKLAGSKVTLIKNASDSGKLFGSVTTQEIADFVNNSKNTEISRSNIVLFDIVKSTGLYKFEVVVHSDVEIVLDLCIAKTQSEADEMLGTLGTVTKETKVEKEA